MRNLLISFILLFSLPAVAQLQVLKGRVVDSSTQAGVAYTNIGVEGTFYGTASDAQGFFELKIPEEYKNDQLFFSAVGYQNQMLPIPDLLKKDFLKIALAEQTYNIEDVDIAAHSRVLFRIIKTAAKNIPANFHQGPLGVKFYYEEETKPNNDSTEQKREAVVELYDETAYRSPSITDAFNKRNYQFSQVKKNFESYSIPTGKTGFDELLEMDIARLSNGILNEKLLNNFDLKLENISQFNGDSVWIISYKTSKTDLAHTGDYYATKYDGQIYISQNNYEILRNECVVEASRNNPHNRSLATTSQDQNQVSYHYTAVYQPQNGKYFLSYLDCDKTFVDVDNQQTTYSRKASALGITTSPVKISGKDYFEDETYVESFWKSFERPE
ncbi:carboxypeptidase-like regulatory domain-containing protein [uncultured Sunxiuqinia sp.]|uniref:carboxypeptidase-like regulatory domain-containing protein n=1 Tax=uncultured Sunxiuqinia sp. TaxID=1573825 RepID=UPI0030DCDCD6|tara:strand:+ start:15405 stop:16559 length:1155 start_codon:yes stop_codon:yes gene_type:complete